MKGQVDAFDLKLRKLGELQSLTVWHDGTGLGAGWHLDYIEVHHMECGKVRAAAAGLFMVTTYILLLELLGFTIQEVQILKQWMFGRSGTCTCG